MSMNNNGNPTPLRLGMQYFASSAMQSLDVQTATYLQFADALVEAAKGDDDLKLSEAFVAFANGIQTQVLREAEQLSGVRDSGILSARGVRQLTGEEKKYYQKVIAAMKDANPKQAIAEIDVVMPKTVIDDVFAELETEHPLLSAIDFQHGVGITEWLMNANTDQLATWSPLCAEIVKELTSGFKKIDIAQNKLSAFLPVCKAMLDLGPVWLDRYVRAVLREALALGVEDGMLNGRGQSQNLHEPIGMRKDITSALDPATGYADKTPVVVTALDPVTYGDLLADLATTENGHPRTISNVIMVVNPVDYLRKVMPATTPRATDGTYRNDVLPFPTKIIQSTRMEQGRAIVGLAKRYLMVSGSGQSGKIEYSDHYHFLEDERVYFVKFYGHGQPKDNNAFALLDISGLQPAVLQVEVISNEEP